MTVLARSLSHMALTSASAACASLAARSNSMVRPTRTPLTPPQPRPCSACSTALPCTSSTPGLRNTWTTAFIRRPAAELFRQPSGRPQRSWLLALMQAPLDHGRHLLHDPQAPGDLRVALDHVAEVAAEAVLVELLVGG